MHWNRLLHLTTNWTACCPFCLMFQTSSVWLVECAHTITCLVHCLHRTVNPHFVCAQWNFSSVMFAIYQGSCVLVNLICVIFTSMLNSLLHSCNARNFSPNLFHKDINILNCYALFVSFTEFLHMVASINRLIYIVKTMIGQF
jgi:hypothetical protein